MSIYRRTINIGIPSIHLRHNETRWWDAEDILWWTAGFVVLISFSIVLVGLCIFWNHKLTMPPPKVITKVIYESALTQEKQAYINQCERNTETDASDDTNPGIPNTTVQPWTCSYAH